MSENNFTVKVDDNELKLRMAEATVEQQNEASKIYNKTFADSLSSGALLRAQTDKILEERGIWNEDKQNELVTLQKQIGKKLKKINGGNIKLWSDARNLALEVRDLRDEMRVLLVDRNGLDNNTAEAQADNIKFSYFVSVCTINEATNKPHFGSLSEYLNSNDIVALESAKKYADILYGIGSDFEKELPENKFLTKYGLCNDDLRLVNKEGHFVDDEMRLIDEDGRYVDADGNFVNIDGDPIDDDGNLTVDAQPFLDEDGDAIKIEEVETDSEVEEQTKEVVEPETD